MLDEVKSLLQKSLRRKEEKYVLEATKELTWHKDADHLKWKSLLTFLFEDHCLSGSDILSIFIQLYAENKKRTCVKLLLKHCKTCRIAACLPVITLSEKYMIVDFDKDLVCENELEGLVEQKEGCLNFDMILTHLLQAWRYRNVVRILSYIKLVSVCYDLEKRTMTEKGKKFLPDKIKGKPHVGQIALRMLYLKTEDTILKRYIGNCYKLASIPDSPVRLILFSVVTHLLFQHEVKSEDTIQLGNTDWKSVKVLQDMPDWAVDKHTFRGKNGKASAKLMKGRPKGMTDDAFKVFHGQRMKRGQTDFFLEGVKHVDKAIPLNPFWERTIQIYQQHPESQQKTIKMTVQYMDKLRNVRPDLFHCSTVKTTSQKSTKRKLPSEQEDPKKQKVEQKKYSPPPDCPLLQIPNGPNKTYTRVDVKEGVVWKGPFTKKKIDRILFVHTVMTSVFGDKHTLKVEERYPFIIFPMLQGSDASLQEEKKVYIDYLQQKQQVEGKFMSRKNMGLQQLHELSPFQIVNLPSSVWAHFFFRFILNVGDSGLYNAVTNSACSFVYGIDMEENRGKKPSYDIINIMFVKKPSKQLCSAILYSIRKNKVELMKQLNIEKDIEKVKFIGQDHAASFIVSEAVEKIHLIKNIVASM